MPHDIHTGRLAPPRARPLGAAAMLGVALPPRARLLGAAALLSGVLALAGCGGSSSPGVAHVSSTKGSGGTGSGGGSSSEGGGSSSEGGGSSSEGAESLQQAMLAYAKCMRANGVPNFPDPNGSGGFPVRGGFDPGSPAANAARAKCRRLLPPGPGSGAPPSRQTLAKFLNIARCMRKHGVPDFPDPRTSAPPGPLPSGISELSDIEGVILLFPSSIDQQSPVFTRAAAACGFPLHNH